MSYILSSNSSLTAADIKSNRKIIKEFKLHNKKYKYRSFRSVFLHDGYLSLIDIHVNHILKSFPEYLRRAFDNISKEEQRLLAATCFIPESEYEDTCNRIASSVSVFDGTNVSREVARAAMHLLFNLPSKDGKEITLGGLIIKLRDCADRSAAA